MRLIGDIGGTNTRLALCDKGVIDRNSVRSFANDQWTHLNKVISAFLADHDVSLKDMAIAVAGPVHGHRARLTNRDWIIERADLIAAFRCENAFLLNDLSALGYAIPAFQPAQLRVVHDGGRTSASNHQALIIGIGTGFNVSPVLKTHDGVHCFAAEAGHMSMPVSIMKMLNRLQLTACQFQTVEDLFSGRGFTKFCQAVTSDQSMQGKDAIQLFKETDHPLAKEAVNNYAGLLGQLLFELTLGYMPSAGIYLAGSVARAVGNAAPQSFLETFTQPCDIRGDQIPNLFTIEDDFAALHGCAVFQA